MISVNPLLSYCFVFILMSVVQFASTDVFENICTSFVLLSSSYFKTLIFQVIDVNIELLLYFRVFITVHR
jgi:hypothetical protein